MGNFRPSNDAVAILVDPNGAPYDIAGILGFGDFNPSDAFRILLVDADGTPYKANGGGGGTPGGSDTEVQFNDGGNFGGASQVVYNKTLGILGVGTQPLMDGAYTKTLSLKTAIAPEAASYLNTAEIYSIITPVGNISGYQHFDVVLEMQGSANNDYMQAMYVAAMHEGSGDIAAIYCQYVSSVLLGSGNIGTNYALYVESGGASGTGTGHITTDYGIYITDHGLPDGFIDNQFRLYLASISTVAITNPYYLWIDSQGVYRIKHDNSFDSVFQAIPALYNPQFTKYTPGAADYERIIERWNGNVAELGTEKGGTGTQRALRLLGSAYKLAALTSDGFVKTSGGDGSLSVQAAGANFGPGLPTSMTVVNGIVTAIS